MDKSKTKIQDRAHVERDWEYAVTLQCRVRMCVCVHGLASFLTLRNSAMLEKYFWLASATFFSAACGFTISKPCRRENTRVGSLKENLHGATGMFKRRWCWIISYLKRSERHTGAGSGGAVSDCGLSSVRHALLLQGPLLCNREGESERGAEETITQWWSEDEGLPVGIWKSWPWWRHSLEPAWHARCRSFPADPDWSPGPPDTHHLQSESHITNSQNIVWRRETSWYSVCWRVCGVWSEKMNIYFFLLSRVKEKP